jgi:nucleoside-diphosphate-sugar epimerase
MPRRARTACAASINARHVRGTLAFRHRRRRGLFLTDEGERNVIQASTTDRNVLLTGATGFIGGELLMKLERFTTGRIWPLVRPVGGAGPQSRLAHRCARSGRGPCGPNVRPIPGDVTLPDWGLDLPDLLEIREGTDLIVHVAADTSFAPQSQNDQTNVAGIRRLIDLARTCRRNPQILYVSTATNGGAASGGCLREEEGCRPENHHFNPYTRSKALAEALLRESGLPVVTVRPPIVFSAGLPDAEFARQILWCVPIAMRFPQLPIDVEARLDVVDVEYVVDCAVALLARPQLRHECYHLSAGEAGCVTLGHFRDVVRSIYPRRTLPTLISPDDWDAAEQRRMLRTRMQRRLFGALRYYLPFINMDVVYDNSRLREELGESMPKVRPLAEYLPDLLGLIRGKAAIREAAAP